MDNIMQLFINEPEREFHVREISKISHKSPTTVSKYLKKYEREGLLNSEKKLNHLFFRSNNENKNFKQIKLNHNLKLLNDSGVIDFLVENFNFPKAIVLFGSFSRAENNSLSDVDLFIISPIKKEIDLKKYEKKMGHKIQLFVYSDDEFKKIKSQNKGLLNNIINGIVVYGFFEVFEL